MDGRAAAAALMWRCAQGLKKLDSVLGGEKWRARRPRRMADVHMLAEEAVAALRGRPGARTSSTAGRTRRARSRSPSSSSASGGSGKRPRGVLPPSFARPDGEQEREGGNLLPGALAPGTGD